MGPLLPGGTNYSAQVWQFSQTDGSGNLTLGSGLTFHSAGGSMYVAAVVTGNADVTLSALGVDTTAALPNDGYGEHENNDTPTAANPLPAFPLVGFKGSLGEGGYDGDTTDYFSFPAAEGDVVTLELDYPADANYTLTLYKPGGTSVLARDDQGSPGSRHIVIGLKAGTYVLKVAAVTGAGDYSINASLASHGYTETEDNDSTAQAGALPGAGIAGSVGASSYDGDTSDYFAIQAQEGNVVTLTLTYPAADGNLSLTLLNGGGAQLYKDSTSNTGLRTFTWGLHAGTNYVLVKAEAGSADYSLSAALDDPGYQEVEDNDSFATAQPLPALPVDGFSGNCGAMGYDGDSKDYYSFPCSDGDIVSVALDYDPTAANLSLTLCNADQSTAHADSAGNSGSRAFAWGLRGGQCFVEVQAVSGHADYTLSVSKTSPGYSEAENNDTTATADILPALPLSGFKGSVGAGGYDGDNTDIFAFSAAAQEQFTFGLTYDQANSNVELDLLNSSGQAIYADSAGNSGTRGFVWGLKAGDYYLRVVAVSGTSDYLLSASKTQLSLDELEDNDTRPAAQQLPDVPFAAFTGHCGKFGYDGDNDDWFFFNLSGSIPFSSTLTYDSGAATLKYYLLDGTGATVDSDTNGNTGTRQVAATIGPGTYYLHVQCSAGGSNYSFDTADS
jgi:hypothetical protein